MREVIDQVFCALCMVCPCSTASWNRHDRNSQSRVANRSRFESRTRSGPNIYFWSPLNARKSDLPS